MRLQATRQVIELSLLSPRGRIPGLPGGGSCSLDALDLRLELRTALRQPRIII